MKHLITPIFLLASALLVPATAHAADDAFCEGAPFEMLAAIDGNWTFKQGAGYGVGGPFFSFAVAARAAGAH
jgi:hypothetical protein